MTTKSKNDTRRSLLDHYVYAPLGAGQLMIEKGRELGDRVIDVAKNRRRTMVDTYGDLAERGRKLVTSIRRSAYTKRAVDQVKTARSQVKSASTSVRKAAGQTATATRAAAKKVS